MDVPGTGCPLPMSGGLALRPGSTAERHPATARNAERGRASDSGRSLRARRGSPESRETRKRLSIFDYRSQGNKIARVGEAAQRAEHASFFQPLDGVADGDGEVQHHAGVAIAVGDAGGAAVANGRRVREVPDRAD